MLRDDGWAEEGWTGNVYSVGDSDIKVCWDNGRRLFHIQDDVALVDLQTGNPNVAFKLYKKRG